MSELMEWDHASDENPIRQIRQLVERIGDLERRIPTGFFDWMDSSGRGTSGTIMNAAGTFNVPSKYSYHIENTPVVLGEVISLIKGLPGLIGFWPMSVLRRESAAEQVRDASGAGYHLTNTGGCTFSVDGYLPYVQLNGSSYLSRADGGAAAWADITGGETQIVAAQRGLTVGGWFYFDNDAGDTREFIVSKRASLAQTAFSFYRTTTGVGGKSVFQIEDGAGGAINRASPRITYGGRWYWLVGRYTPGVAIEFFQWHLRSANTTSITATLQDVTPDLIIGARGGPMAYMTGRAALVFLTHTVVPDDTISMIYYATRDLFTPERSGS